MSVNLPIREKSRSISESSAVRWRSAPKRFGQHVYLLTDDVPEFYAKLGFVEQPIGIGQVVN